MLPPYFLWKCTKFNKNDIKELYECNMKKKHTTFRMTPLFHVEIHVHGRQIMKKNKNILKQKHCAYVYL